MLQLMQCGTLVVFKNGESCFRAQVDQTLDFFGTLKSQHHEVAAKTRQLHDNCQQLVRANAHTAL